MGLRQQYQGSLLKAGACWVHSGASTLPISFPVSPSSFLESYILIEVSHTLNKNKSALFKPIFSNSIQGLLGLFT